MTQTSVVAFVDWTAQIHIAGGTGIRNPRTRATVTLENVSKIISSTLKKLSANTNVRFRVTLRLYHGWHRGLNPTENRIAVMDVVNDPDFVFSVNSKDIHIENQIGYGETLLNSLPHRFVQQSGKSMPKINLPDTFRRPLNDNIPREKMVDTSLACDILTHARSDSRDWRLVLAEDDDLVPALFVAEAWSKVAEAGRCS